MTSPAIDILPVLTTGLCGAAAFFSGTAYGLLNPRSQMWGPLTWRSDTTSSSIALTFDDGPLPGTTDAILNTLGEVGARATFFVIGCHVQRFPDLVRRMHNEGHAVANHTYSHSHMGMFRRDSYWINELRRTDDAIEQIIGRRPAFFRPPMGYKQWHSMNAAIDTGHRVITWSVRGNDVVETTAQAILDRLIEPAQAGDIIVLHDGNDPQLRPQVRGGTRDAIRPLIEGLRRRGLEPARLDQLLQCPAYQDAAPSPNLVSPRA